jgi:hypothetical protein
MMTIPSKPGKSLSSENRSKNRNEGMKKSAATKKATGNWKEKDEGAFNKMGQKEGSKSQSGSGKRSKNQM